MSCGGLRIIPARAGPTRSTGKTPWVSSDHPRSCGANERKYQSAHISSGSSPLVRGQLGFERGLPAFGRIIPARAGPTTVDLLDARGKADHPRSCGANRHDQIVGILHGGSSPLVRGQHTPYIIGVNKKRIIPARAGPTARRAGESKEQADHPRSCGANAPPGLT